MTKLEVLNLYQGINRLGRLIGVKFVYAMSKNMKALQAEIDSLQKAMEMTDEFKKFEDARIALINKYAEKDDKGVVKITNNEYIIGENKAVFDAEFETLRQANQAAFDARQEQIKQYTELLKTDCNVTLFKVKLDDVPKDITAQELNGIYPLIEEA